MDKYIIVREMKMNGVPTTLYFETISECTNNQVMNVFQEHITRDKAKAKRFYDIEEAERFKALFSREYNTSTILTVKK